MDKERRIRINDDLPADDDVIAHKHHRADESLADDDPGRRKHTDEDDGPDVEAHYKKR